MRTSESCGVVLCVVVAALLLATGVGAATFTSDTSIGAGDAAYDGQDIVVSGCTVTIDGAHSFASLAIENSGAVTHSPGTPMSLSIAGSASVGALSRIDVTGRGHGPGGGPGAGQTNGYVGTGAGHGGFGSSSNGGNAPGNVYDSITGPAMLGSGGGLAQWSTGGAGGGAIALTVVGTLTVDGSISANGASGTGNSDRGGGGGSGGSVLLTCGLLTGSGAITANGGAAGKWSAGGGGGGRIAVYYDSNTFRGAMTAYGNEGYGGCYGGAGTVFAKATSVANGELVLDNGGLAGMPTPITSPVPYSLLIRNGAIAYPESALGLSGLTIGSGGVLTHLPGAEGTLVTVGGDVVVESGGAINLNGRGYGTQSGPGAGTNNGYQGSGAGHGGLGGIAYQVSGYGNTYDSITEPVMLGSGGGKSGGGAGGGAIALTAGGTLTVDGTISANGTNAPASDGAGGGSGGSVLLRCGVFAGSGAITANGGATGYHLGGGGGGGRIAVYCDINAFTGAMAAYGNSGYGGGGGAGTVFLKAAGVGNGELVLDNGGLAGMSTPIISPVSFSLLIRNGAIAYPESSLNLSGLNIGSGGVLTHLPGAEATSVTVGGNVAIEAGGAIDLNGRGYGTQSGPGAGTNNGYQGSGAGHGGLGGVAFQVNGYGNTYDSITEPVMLGSGGGKSSGGAGGGAIALTTTGTLTLDGTISANGANAPASDGAGGGSGGSVLLSCGVLTGSGAITANGGATGYYLGGGGAGGRIAVYYDSNTFMGAMTAYGGSGYAHSGGAGTVYTRLRSQPSGSVLIDSGGATTHWTPITSSEAFDLTIGSGCWVNPNPAIRLSALTIRSGGRLSHQSGVAGTSVTVLGNATIEAGGSIFLDGHGYGAQSGPGAGPNNGYQGSGGGHGGYGGIGYQVENYGIGNIYDSLTEPVMLGSGGGKSSGGAGGGAIALTIGGTLIVNGSISANGANAPASDGAGGGSGGSVLLKCGVLTGSGTIAANGGATGFWLGGGGGGGRIAVYCHDRTGFDQAKITANGGWGYGAGRSGTIHFSELVPPIVARFYPEGQQSGIQGMLFVEFDQPIKGETLTLDDVSIIGPDGPVALSGIRATSITFPTEYIPRAYLLDVSTHGVQALYRGGDYEIHVGPHVQNEFGQEMASEQVGHFSIKTYTLEEAKALAPDTWVLLEPTVVSAKAANGVSSVRSRTGLVGMQVEDPVMWLGEIGQTSVVEAWVRSASGVVKLDLDYAVTLDDDEIGVAPVLMKTKDIGGGASLGLQTGVVGGVGPNSFGMLVKVCGKITALDPGGAYVYIDDGCGLRDGTQTDGVDNVGLRLIGFGTGRAIGDFVSAEGIVSGFKNAAEELRPSVASSRSGSGIEFLPKLN